MTTTVFSFVVVLGILIFIHELGHFLVARLFGVGVERFSLGFGPRLFGKTVGITDYRISAVPLGGYVKMVGEEPDAEIDPADIPISFTHKSVTQRALIVAAGPVFNLLLAVLIFFGFFMVSGIEDVTPVVRKVDPVGVGQGAGLKTGDWILAIDGSPVDSWYDILGAVEDSGGNPLSLQVRRGDAVTTVRVAPELKTGEDLFGDPEPYYDLGISGLPEPEALVGGVSEGFPAQRAGLVPGDRIVAINGIPIENWRQMRDTIAASGGQDLRVGIDRDGERREVVMAPELKKNKNALGEVEERYLIGISAPGINLPDGDLFTKRLSFTEALAESVERTYLVAELSLVGVAKIFSGAISKDNLGGPIMIAKMAGDQAREGVDKLIQFIAFISINLAILNILPIPVLDGGHLLFFAIEAVTRRPVNVKFREFSQQAGFFALLLLMAFVFYNDIMRYFIRT